MMDDYISDNHTGNGNGSDSDTSDYPLNFNIPWQWNVIVSLCLAVIGTVANVALLLVIFLNRHLRTTSNILVGNLAIADLLMFFFSVPMTTVMWLFVDWPRGPVGTFLCKMGGGAWALAQVVCVTSLTAISVERYFSLQRRIQMKRTVAFLVVIWAVAMCFAIPMVILGHVIYHPQIDLGMCQLLPDNLVAIRAYFTAYGILTYLLPLLVIVCCYIGMARALITRASGESVESIRARRRLAIVVLILAIAFTVFWFPYHFFNFFFLYADWETIVSGNYNTYFRLIEIAHVLIYVNSCLNPFVVFFISRVHRKPLLDFLCRCRKRQSAEASKRRYAPVPESVYAETTMTMSVQQ